MRQRLALPSVVVLVVFVHGHVYLLLHLDVLHHGHGHVLHDRVGNMLVHRNLLDHLHFLDDGHVHGNVHLRHVVVVDRMDLVRHVDGHVFARKEEDLAGTRLYRF